MSNRRGRGTVERAPIVPERVRYIGGKGFAFIHHAFLREGFFASLSKDELLLYLLLVLAGDRNGISFYHQDSLSSLLQMPFHVYMEARNGLIDKDLVAFDGLRFQVLSLPERPVCSVKRPLKTKEQLEDDDPATIRQMIRHSLTEAKGER